MKKSFNILGLLIYFAYMLMACAISWASKMSYYDAVTIVILYILCMEMGEREAQ